MSKILELESRIADIDRMIENFRDFIFNPNYSLGDGARISITTIPLLDGEGEIGTQVTATIKDCVLAKLGCIGVFSGKYHFSKNDVYRAFLDWWNASGAELYNGKFPVIVTDDKELVAEMFMQTAISQISGSCQTGEVVEVVSRYASIAGQWAEDAKAVCGACVSVGSATNFKVTEDGSALMADISFTVPARLVTDPATGAVENVLVNVIACQLTSEVTSPLDADGFHEWRAATAVGATSITDLYNDKRLSQVHAIQGFIVHIDHSYLYFGHSTAKDNCGMRFVDGILLGHLNKMRDVRYKTATELKALKSQR